MKNIYRLLGLMSVVVLMASCLKDNYIDTGLSNGRFNGSLLKYMEANSYDWDSTVILVRHAGPRMVRIFEGKDPEFPEVTFLGPTNNSIRRYLIQYGYKQVTDLDPQWCESVLLKHLMKGKIYLDDIPAGRPTERGEPIGVGTGGKDYTTLSGQTVWLFTIRGTYNGLPEKGAKQIQGFTIYSWKRIFIASSNIEPDHCVVHSLYYGFTLGDM